jgi:hypothetical protein
LATLEDAVFDDHILNRSLTRRLLSFPVGKTNTGFTAADVQMVE